MARQARRGANVATVPWRLVLSDVSQAGPGEPELVSLGQDASGKFAEYRFELRRDDVSLALRVVRRRRKTMALYVEKSSCTELRVPLNCSWPDIASFALSKFDWILQAQQEVAARPSAPANVYEPGGSVRYLGRSYTLELARSRYAVCAPDGEVLYIACRQPHDPGSIEKQVLTWYRRQAEQLLAGRVEAINARFADAIAPGAISVRKMKARWGSCASNGDICFNLLVIQEDLSQIDFVVAHELCHLRHFAHNGAFYRLLGRVMPDWRERESRLGMV